MRLDITAQAEADIRRIFVYGIEAHGQDAADHYLEHLNEAFHRLTVFPHLGRVYEKSRRYRVFLVGDRRVYYRIDGDTILIVRVFHQRAGSASLDE